MSKVVVLGSLNADLVLRAARIPRPGETLTGSDLQVFPGGKGANQAYAAARLGASVLMAGRVGSDSFGDMLRANLQSAGVDCRYVEPSKRATGVAAITVLPNGDNAILLSPGANHDIAPEWVGSRVECVEPGDVVLLQLEIPLAATMEALSCARRAGARCILDPAPAQRVDAELLRAVDIITPNQTEAACLLDQPDAPPVTIADGIAACLKLKEVGARTVVLKMGNLGCILADGDPVPIRGFEVEAVDTTGAGDTFNAALAVAVLSGRALAEALEFANPAAALSVTRAGAQASAPALSEVETFLSSRATGQAAAGYAS